MTGAKIIKTKTRKPRKAAVIEFGNVVQLIPYPQYVAERISELTQTRGGQYA